MQHETIVQRCRRIVAQLNAGHDWNLGPADELRYVEQLVACGALSYDAGEEQIHALVARYHADHAMVEALRDPQHPNHTHSWADLSAQLLRLLAAHPYTAHLTPDNFTDLLLEFLLTLRCDLPTFRYQSRLHTWACVALNRSLLERGRAEFMRQPLDDARMLLRDIPVFPLDCHGGTMLDHWTQQDPFLETIGKHLILSAARVPALLAQAHALLTPPRDS